MKRFSFAVLGLLAVSFAADNLAQWSKYKNIAVNTKASGANVVGNVLKVPVLVRLDSVNAADVFSGASAGGADIRFANAAGVPKAFEIEYWNATAKQAAIWVLADTVKGNDSVANLRMYWGNSSAAPGSNGPAVFETSNGYVGAWHLGNATGTNPRPASVAGAPAAVLRNGLSGEGPVPGIIGLADSLRGIGAGEDGAGSNYLDMGRNAAYQNNNYAGFSDFTTGFTYSIWMYSVNTATFTRILATSSDEDTLSLGPNGTENRIVLMGNQNGSAATPNLAVRWGTTSSNLANGAYTANTWVNLVFTKVAGSSPVRVYRNGVLYGSSGNAADMTVAVRNLFWIGRPPNADGYFGGKFDNITLAKVSRDSNFVKLSHETQKAGASAVALGTTQTQTVIATAVTKLAYSDTLKAADTLNVLVGKAVSVNPVVVGGPVDSFKVVSGTLPSGITLTKTNGVLSGTASAALAAANVQIRVYGHAVAGDSLTRTVRIAAIAVASLNYTPDSIVSNINVVITSLTPTFTGATPAYSVTPNLPTGLSLNATTGVISGTPTVAVAMAPYTIKAKTFIDSTTKVVRIRVIDPTSINGKNGLAAGGFSAEPSAQGVLFRVGGVVAGEKVTLSLVDMSGRAVYIASFAGETLNWNGVGTKGQAISSGVYIARVKILDAQGKMRKVLEHKIPLAR